MEFEQITSQIENQIRKSERGVYYGKKKTNGY